MGTIWREVIPTYTVLAVRVIQAVFSLVQTLKHKDDGVSVSKDYITQRAQNLPSSARAGAGSRGRVMKKRTDKQQDEKRGTISAVV